MKMTRRMALVIALVCGLLAAVLTYIYLNSLKQKEAEQPLTREVSVVTPIETIEAGTVIKAAMLRTKKMPEQEAPREAVGEIRQVAGDVAAEELTAGQPILASQLASRKGGVDLSFVVPSGMRAVTVALDPIIGVAGFLKPGDHVDVVVTFKIADEVITRTVLQNVQLLALGETTIVSKERGTGEEEAAEPKAKTQPNATLAVTPADAQKLIISDAQGTIRLVLRRRGEIEYRALEPTDLFSITGVKFEREEVEEEHPPSELAGPVPPEGIVTPAGPPKPTVEVIRGSQRETVTP